MKHGCTADQAERNTARAIHVGGVPVDSDQPCGWQECEERAVSVRGTPWGDLFVCESHVDTPLFDEGDGR